MLSRHTGGKSAITSDDPAPHAPVNPLYRPDVDGLRAIAILSVIAYHAFPNSFPGGFIGVDIFFVISGYLISSIIVQNLHQQSFSFTWFYYRRVNRILPPLLLVLACTLIVGWPFLMNDEYLELGKHVSAGAVFSSNFVLWGEAGYFDRAAESKPLLHLWSLAIEEQFYIVWPLVLWLLFKCKRSPLVATGLLLLASFLFNIYSIQADPTGAFYSPLTRFWELLAGCLLAIHEQNQRNAPGKTCSNGDQASPRLKEASAGAGALLLLLGFALINESRQFPGIWAALPVLGSALIILAGPNTRFNRAFLSIKVMVLVGTISFPLYLWHWPILAGARILEGQQPGSVQRAIAILLTFALAMLTKRWIENPVRQQHNRPATALLLLALLAFVGLAGFLPRSAVYQSYWERSPAAALKQSAQASPLRDQCHFPQTADFATRQPCSYFDRSPPRVAVFGNSHAVELAHALGSTLAQRGISITQYTMSGCRHLYRSSKPNDICDQWHAHALAQIAQNKTIDTVVISFRNERHAEQPEDAQSLGRMVDTLREHGKKVIFVLQAPMLKKDIEHYIRTASDSEDIPSRDLADWHKLYRHGYRLADTLKEKVTLLDPTEHFCRDAACYAVIDRQSLFFDNDHMSLAGARIISEEISRMISDRPN